MLLPFLVFEISLEYLISCCELFIPLPSFGCNLLLCRECDPHAGVLQGTFVSRWNLLVAWGVVVEAGAVVRRVSERSRTASPGLPPPLSLLGHCDLSLTRFDTAASSWNSEPS